MVTRIENTSIQNESQEPANSKKYTLIGGAATALAVGADLLFAGGAFTMYIVASKITAGVAVGGIAAGGAVAYTRRREDEEGLEIDNWDEFRSAQLLPKEKID